ncbi:MULTISPECIES: hypothetical protein [unclassified Streptomyces]|uniref:hypothetical protein n=1 Tax=Streptomyces TaxID=1883 RepID=UPI000823C1B2|nr:MULTISPECIES: hypothetical protein [unclassified Streptomyces]ARI52463.1 hypothetical protein A6E92_09900 [Streptomyces sp. S8]SCK17224.1 hypothetical protein YUWDRAFT_01147 [Streptomyces sp. AmelKG-D3]
MIQPNHSADRGLVAPSAPSSGEAPAPTRHAAFTAALAGGGHLTATDVPALAHAAGLRERWPEPLYAKFLGTLAASRAATVTRAYTTAFSGRFLLGHRRPLLDGPTPRHPEIGFRWTRGRREGTLVLSRTADRKAHST